MARDLANSFWKFEGDIYRGGRSSDGRLTLEMWDGSSWVKGGILTELDMYGHSISAEEAAALTSGVASSKLARPVEGPGLLRNGDQDLQQPGTKARGFLKGAPGTAPEAFTSPPDRPKSKPEIG